MKERKPRFFLQSPHLMADRGMGDMQFRCRAGEISVARRSFEGPESVEGRQSAYAHVLDILTTAVKSHRLKSPFESSISSSSNFRLPQLVTKMNILSFFARFYADAIGVALAPLAPRTAIRAR
jgi:hypothetical protein